MCNPYKYREKNAQDKVMQTVTKVVVPIVVFSVMINIPRFYETMIVTTTTNITLEDNITIIAESVTFEITPLRMDPDYVW